MANIVDYLIWRGDLTFDERPFNDVDNVILSTLAYLDYTGVVPGVGEKGMSIAEANRRLFEVTDGSLTGRIKALGRYDPRLVEYLIKAPRFAEITIHDYVQKFDFARSLQFSAVQFDISPHVTYVAFRGTDNSLIGWRENFMLSCSITEAQKEAASYLKRALEMAKEQHKTLYVGGHSKGGNLAAYSAVTCPSDLKDLVSFVWNNDGPGFAPEVLAESPFSQLGGHYRRIVPAYDIVGILFERSDDPRMVTKSSAQNAVQHDPFTWKVTSCGMDEADDLAPESKLLRTSIATWISDIQLEQRATVVDELFDALEAAGIYSLSDLSKNAQSLKKTLSAIDGLDDSTKLLFVSFVGNVLSATMDVASIAAQEAAATAVKTVKGALEDWIGNSDSQQKPNKK